MEEKQLTSRELEEQANALLAEADFEEIKLPKKAKKAAVAKKANEDTAQAEKPAEKYPPLDEKLVASLPAAALLQGSEKLMEIFAKGKAKGKLSSSDLMETIDEMNLESEQLDQIYDSLETLGIDIGTAEAIDSNIDDVEPPMEEIAEIEEEELVDPNELVDSFSTDDPVRMYLKEIGKVSLLSADEEISLATAMSAGVEAKQKLEEAEKNGTELSEEEMKALKSAVKKGERSKQRLAEANLRLVVSIAKRYVGRGMLFLDLIQEGNLGLIKAVGTFKSDRNIKLATYASRCIENEILMYLRKSSNRRQDASIDEPLNTDTDGNELLLMDVLTSDDPQVGEELERSAERAALRGAVGRLSPRERRIMELRFGLNHEKEHTQKEVADTLGISQSYISRLEKRIIRRLRRELEAVG